MRYLYKFLLLIFIFSAFSCVRYRNLVMLDEKIGAADTASVSVMEPYKIQKKDVLDISVASTDASSISIFTKSLGNGGSNQVNETSLYINGYVVDDSGYVSMPIIGNIYVEGKTKYEIKTVLQEKINHYYKYATVDVKLISFRISVLGEVTQKGTYTIFRDQINLLEAIALTNGFTDLSKRSEVKVIRNVNGKNKIRVIDFTSEVLINDPWFYLQPNDIIYVEPVRAKAVKNNVTTISLTLSALSFFLVVVNLLRK